MSILENIKTYIKLPVILIITNSITLIALIGISIYSYNSYQNYECICDETPIACPTEEENEKFYIDVKGAVKTPGVYEVTDDLIINDVIELAGGFKSNAYTKNINLSKKISNEMVIYIYTKTEYNNLKASEEPAEVTNNNYNITGNITNGESIITPDTTTSSTSSTDATTKVNINTATLEQLMTLSGIGESKAQAIIEYRTTIGLFNSIEDIKNISGIGDALFENIKDSITV